MKYILETIDKFSSDDSRLTDFAKKHRGAFAAALAKYCRSKGKQAEIEVVFQDEVDITTHDSVFSGFVHAIVEIPNEGLVDFNGDRADENWEQYRYEHEHDDINTESDFKYMTLKMDEANEKESILKLSDMCSSSELAFSEDDVDKIYQRLLDIE